MKCPNCGTELQKAVKFCPSCGNKIVADNVQNQPAAPMNETPKESPQTRTEAPGEVPSKESESGPKEASKRTAKTSPKRPSKSAQARVPKTASKAKSKSKPKEKPKANLAAKTKAPKKDKTAKHRTQAAEKKESSGILKWIIGGIILLALGVVAYFYLSPGANEADSQETADGTTDQANGQSLDDAYFAILTEDFEQAEIDLKKALDENPDSEEISNLYNQTKLYNEAAALFAGNNFEQGLSKAKESLEYAAESEYSDKLTEKGNALVTEIEDVEKNFATYESDYEKAQELQADGNFDEALAILAPYLEEGKLDGAYYEELKNNMEELHQTVETEKEDFEAEQEAEEEREKEEASDENNEAMTTVGKYIEALPNAVNNGNFSYQAGFMDASSSFYTEQRNFIDNTHASGIRENLNHYEILSAEANGETASVRVFESFEVINTEKGTTSNAEYEATYYLQKSNGTYYITGMEIN